MICQIGMRALVVLLGSMLLTGCFPVMIIGAITTAPFMWENMPTCDMRHRPLLIRCREVRGQWGGERVEVHDPEVPW